MLEDKSNNVLEDKSSNLQYFYKPENKGYFKKLILLDENHLKHFIQGSHDVKFQEVGNRLRIGVI